VNIRCCFIHAVLPCLAIEQSSLTSEIESRIFSSQVCTDSDVILRSVYETMNQELLSLLFKVINKCCIIWLQVITIDKWPSYLLG